MGKAEPGLVGEGACACGCRVSRLATNIYLYFFASFVLSLPSPTAHILHIVLYDDGTLAPTLITPSTNTPTRTSR